MYQETRALYIPEPVVVSEVSLGERIVAEALRWEGAPSIKYRGQKQGMDPEVGFDCSGFVVTVFRNCGINLPHRRSIEMFDNMKNVSGILPGDLRFSTHNGVIPQHVGIVIDEDRWIHAPGRDNTVVEIRELKKTPVRRPKENAIYSENPIGFKRVTMQPGVVLEIL